MGIIDTVKTIKKIQVQDVVMIKIGKFIYSYGKDAYIVSLIFVSIVWCQKVVNNYFNSTKV